jgi:hypothetical protein
MSKPIINMLEQHGYYLSNSFLDQNEFLDLSDSFDEYTFEPSYQPSGEFYGNRLQAYPVYESDHLSEIDPKLNSKIQSRVEEILGGPIEGFYASLRYINMNEIKRSAQNNKYGIKHVDPRHCAGVLYFDQAIDGGTAFFRNIHDIKPDAEVAAYPNRCIIYNGQTIHAPCNDFTYDKRRILVFFFNIKLDK